MSRSSTDTGMGTPCTGQPPSLNWSMLQHQQHANNCASNAIGPKATTASTTTATGLDRMSVCSSHGSFGSNSSEYSVPRMMNDSWYDHAPHTQDMNSKNQRASGNASVLPQSCKTCPPSRPPKSKVCTNAKAAMPLPIGDQSADQQQSNKFVGSYENYDVPRPTIHKHQLVGAIAAADNYDTPKKIQECLTEDMNCNPAMALASMPAPATATKQIDIYGNYDVPSVMSANTASGAGKETEDRIRFAATGDNGVGPDGTENTARIDCTCNKVMSWADSWISLPYCRRGNSIENTGVPINKVRLSGEGKMPVVQPSGELAVYATVDMTKKIKRRILDDMNMCKCLHSNNLADASCTGSSYINIEPTMPSTSAKSSDVDEINQNKSQSKATMENNYANLDYALDYENAKEVLQKAGFSVTHIEQTLAQCLLHRRPEDYILMEPSKKNFPGYLPMSPAAPNNGTALSETDPQLTCIDVHAANEIGASEATKTATSASNQQTATVDTHPKTPPLPTKSDLMKRILGDKSASNPALGPAVDRSKKRAEQETRIPGSAMMSSLNSGGSPYTRKQLMDNGDLLSSHDKRVFGRKRSSSADSTRLSAISNLISSKAAHRRSVSAIESNGSAIGRRASTPCLRQEGQTSGNSPKPASPATVEQQSVAIDTDDEISLSMNQSQMSQQSQQSAVYIRRSASVPCKAQNRDSSSSNDSGVSTGSTRQRSNGEYTEFELPLTTAMSAIRHASVLPAVTSTLHASLPRRSKSFDPLREITFQFARNGKFTAKSTSAEAEIPICTPKAINGAKGGYVSPNDAASLTGNGHPYIDSRSTSSGTSDMSDYIETLSLSSHSSSDTPEGLRYYTHQMPALHAPQMSQFKRNQFFCSPPFVLPVDCCVRRHQRSDHARAKNIKILIVRCSCSNQLIRRPFHS